MFTPPRHLFSDPIALSEYLDENFPGEMEAVPVTDDNIETMEAAAGFLMPEEYVDHWLEKGSQFFSKDEFVFALYCYNADGPNGNDLYSFLTFWQNYKRRTFALIDNEKTFLTKCCWVLGMIGSGDEMLIFVTDPLGTVRAIHFAESLRNISEEAFDQAVQAVLDAKTSLKAFMSSETYLAMAEDPIITAEEEEEEDDNAAEEAETLAFLEKHNIKAVTYDEILAALNVDQLFDYWEDDADNDMANNYESERDYYDNFSGSFFYCDGDLTIDGNLSIPHKHVRLLAVRGNMTINGKVSEDNGYYVTGNTTVDYLALGEFQKTLGLETVRFVASAWGQDDEMVHSMSFRKINAPYFFSWFYDLACFEFAPNTLITVLYNYDELSAYETENAILIWHEYAYAFNPDLYYGVEESHYDVLNLGTGTIYETLKAGNPVLREGVTAETIQLTRKGIRLNKEDDAAGAYQCFKDAIAKGPGYYLAYYYAGKCLFDKKAYTQAKELFAKGIPLTPEKLLYEIECFEHAALTAVRLGEYDQAITWAKAAVQKYPSALFCLRVIGEALIYQNKLEEAKTYLEQSVAITSQFTNNWLLGLVYHLQGNEKKGEELYQIAVQKNSKAQPYAQHKNLNYFYGDAVTLDWDTKRQTATVKDQAYWDQFFTDTLAKYGPDMYKKTGKFPSEWLSAKLATIPEQYRSKSMLQALLDHTTNGEPDVDGKLITFFKPELFTPAIILQAVKRADPARYNDIPAEFITEAIWLVHPQGIDLSFIPAEHLSYELCFKAVTQSQYNYKYVPEAFKDERMTIALIAGGALNSFPVKELPSKYHSTEYVKKAIELGIEVIKRIPVKLFDKEVYAYAVEKYGQHPEWPFIVEQYDRDRWRWGSYVDMMGEKVKKYGIDIFDHVDTEQIDEYSYAYYKKHLGHLPAWQEKAEAKGWNGRSKIKDEYSKVKEYDYDTFDKVWACFWDEAFIIKAITSNDTNNCERIYDLPQQYLTQKICDVAVERNSYDFEFVPKQFVTQQMCESAVSRDYGSALEFVPLPMRTEKVCGTAVSMDAVNIKFVPLALRTPALLAAVITRDKDLSKYIPHEQYTAVYEILAAKFKNRFTQDYLLLNAGLGLIIDKKYEDARKKLAEVEAVKNAEAPLVHQAAYYIGWSYFLEADAAKAKEYFKKSQDYAKAQKIDDRDWLTYPYASFQLPPVGDVYEFSKSEFDKQMHEITLLVQNKEYEPAIEMLASAEKLLTDAQSSETRLWAYVWDHQRYVLYEAGKKEESLALCKKIIADLSKITLWDYLEEFNPIRAALRAAHNNVAYHCYETATDLKGVEEGLKHIKVTMKTVAPIEDKSVLNYFYETQALLLHKAMGFDAAYQKDFDKAVAKIDKLKLREAGLLSDEFIQLGVL